MAYVFYSDCIGWPRDQLDDLDYLIDNSVQVSRLTFIKHVGTPNYLWLARKLGYSRTPHGGGLTMKRDWHVGYFKAPFRGHKCYFVLHSAIEYVFVPAEIVLDELTRNHESEYGDG